MVFLSQALCGATKVGHPNVGESAKWFRCHRWRCFNFAFFVGRRRRPNRPIPGMTRSQLVTTVPRSYPGPRAPLERPGRDPSQLLLGSSKLLVCRFELLDRLRIFAS
jgi:hypothetical protein